ncbi:MAG TPA: GntR family transcriptional regulator [Xanthobacteraceae bacterium]|jgi:DNA-binding GntR family transcriptional regulator|nr:GntR family transcriptional regulator [Xanthobacteraceae bacterium]
MPAPHRQSDVPPRSGIGRPRAHNAAHRVYRDLRDDIVSMRRQPGQPIVEKEIALKRGVSRTPVREALLRLADEALVDIFPQSGTFVARIPASALPEAILMRTALEQTTARLAAERADAGQLARLNGLIDRQRRVAARGDRDRFHAADEAFHAAIAAAAGHPGIWRFIEQVKIQVDRYRRLTLPVPGRMGRVLDEHKQVLAAIAAHDPDGAAAAMAAHLEALRASIGDVRDLNPDYFVDGSLPRGAAI